MNNIFIVLFIGLLFILMKNRINISFLAWLLNSVGISLIGVFIYEFIKLNPFSIFINNIKRILIKKDFKRIIKRNSNMMPSGINNIIISDIGGVITPPYRGEVDLIKFNMVKEYFRFIDTPDGSNSPKVLFVTGRSQGYVELLSQIFGLVNSSLDIPIVIENGSALYYPYSKKTEILVPEKDLTDIKKLLYLLKKEYPNNNFEPKSFMITINPKKDSDENIQTLFKLITQSSQTLCESEGIDIKKFKITHSSSAVDITSSNVSRYEGLKHVLIFYNQQKNNEPIDIKNAVCIIDSMADKDLLSNCSEVYCSKNIHDEEVINNVFDKYPKNIINKNHVDLFLYVLQKTSNITII